MDGAGPTTGTGGAGGVSSIGYLLGTEAEAVQVVLPSVHLHLSFPFGQ